MILSLRQFGAIKGIFLGILRLLKCHPFSFGKNNLLLFKIKKKSES